MTNKRLISGFAFLAILFTLSVSATIKPSLENMVKNSDFIVVGKIIHVEESNELTKVITIKIFTLLKGKSNALGNTFKVNYTRVGKGNINFLSLLEHKTKQVIYLEEIRKSQNIKVKLKDAWFGVEESNFNLIHTIKKIIANSPYKLLKHRSGQKHALLWTR